MKVGTTAATLIKTIPGEKNIMPDHSGIEVASGEDIDKIARPELIHDGNDVVSLGLYADQLEGELHQSQTELHLHREFLLQEIRRMKEKGEEVGLFQERIDQIDRCLRRES